MNTNNLEAKDEGEEGPTICLFVQHDFPVLFHSLNVIRLPRHLSDHDHTIDAHGFIIPSDPKPKPNISVLTLTHSFLPHPASVNLGSKIYYLGGMTRDMHDPYLQRMYYQVQVFDINYPDQKMQSVAPMNTPKESPCVFVAHGMIYALGSPIWSCHKKLPVCQPTGFFERYDPISDHWQLLPDPPFYHLWDGAQPLDRPTVVGRHVFLGVPGSFLAIFDLDKLMWEQLQSPQLADRFPYGSLFLHQSASLYHLCGPAISNPGTSTSSLPGCCFKGPLLVVKRIPLTASKQGDYNCSLLKSPGLISAKEQIVVQGTDLDENKSFTKSSYHPWRDLFHVGGRFFCYVVTAQLVERRYRTHYEPKSRAIWIKFFEEVPADTDNCNGDDNNNYRKTIFRPLASFCYKINNISFNLSSFVRCSIIGTVPDSWINAPLKKKQESKLTSVSEEMDSITLDWSSREKYEVEQTRHHELENTVNLDRETRDFEKLLAASEAQLSFLKAVLARKIKRLKSYEGLVSHGRLKESWKDFWKAYALSDVGGENRLH